MGTSLHSSATRLYERAFRPDALKDLLDGLLGRLIRAIEPEANSSHRLANRVIKDRRPWLEDILIWSLFVAAPYYGERWSEVDQQKRTVLISARKWSSRPARISAMITVNSASKKVSASRDATRARRRNCRAASGVSGGSSGAAPDTTNRRRSSASIQTRRSKRPARSLATVLLPAPCVPLMKKIARSVRVANENPTYMLSS